MKKLLLLLIAGLVLYIGSIGWNGALFVRDRPVPLLSVESCRGGDGTGPRIFAALATGFLPNRVRALEYSPANPGQAALLPEERALTDDERDTLQESIDFLAQQGGDQNRVRQLQQMLDDGKILADSLSGRAAQQPTFGDTMTVDTVVLGFATTIRTRIILAHTLLHEVVHVNQTSKFKFSSGFSFALCTVKDTSEMEAYYIEIAALSRWFVSFQILYELELPDYNQELVRFNELLEAPCLDKSAIGLQAIVLGLELESLKATLEHMHTIADEYANTIDILRTVNYEKGDFLFSATEQQGADDAARTLTERLDQARDALDLVNRYLDWASTKDPEVCPELDPTLEPLGTLGPAEDLPPLDADAVSAITAERQRFEALPTIQQFESFVSFASLVASFLDRTRQLPPCIGVNFQVLTDLPPRDLVGPLSFGMAMLRGTPTLVVLGGLSGAGFDLSVAATDAVLVLGSPAPAAAFSQHIEKGTLVISERAAAPAFSCKSPGLSNLWLTAQGDKLAPDTCLSGNDGIALTQAISRKVGGLDKHGDPRALGGFSFQVNFDETKVCVALRPGPLAQAWVAAGGACIIFDSTGTPNEGQAPVQGSATIACNSLGKGPVSPPVDDNLLLAEVIVQPMPDQYLLMRPNNGNGNVVQVINKACRLTDRQGGPIAPPEDEPTCTDADITIRYLEGDVVPDCVIDTVDTQAEAFRWGSQKGGLLYSDFFNTEPSKPKGDDDIDINDLQFVYGRFGSTCSGPYQQPEQAPVNPKAT